MSTTTPQLRTYDHFVDGGALASDAERLQRHDPASGRLVAEYAHASEHDVDRAVTAARRAFDDGRWSRLPGAERARVLRRFAALIDGARDLLAALDSEEVGKPLRLAEGDIAGAIGHVEYAASLAHTDHGDSWTQLERGFVAYATQVPLGVAALIVPWNFPAGTLLQKLPYALAAGCTAVVKPSEFTSSSALEIARLAAEAGIPDGVVNVVTGLGPSTGAALVAHPGVDVISFTGSTATGRAVAAEAGRGLKRVGLELGGKAANVVFADADFEAAADAAVFGAFFNQGECCVAGSRLLVEHAIADEFIGTVVDRARSLVVGDPRDPRTDVGPLIHQRHRDRVESFIASGREQGATLLCGGERPDDAALADGAFVAPTIFGGVAPAQRIFAEEIFGPVLAVTTFATLEEAAQLANATSYGLSSSVWSESVDTVNRIADELRSGTVWVNTVIDGNPALAFGGTKASGVGREAGFEGLREYTESKTVQIRSGRRTLPLPRR
ncbi:aldehyde dehydrogenase family protein [Conexibacter stalactiti]|uniref:Aldehyde dehydrogenase family protein n=1 Tax=Conexibacter stalactiti TaxID=1940611 RepID=A0ABU4HXT8_9ACTN|nr:aldehyde dehydrogenase family protein [Conexibacter stalactiti]MDW5598143.1 aldehyde dehydrogenase family protein [Conexibacter stalactiti]MEC5038785.1 aldehyde dehydrogenase family protein [Conexibacter stalactiti]